MEKPYNKPLLLREEVYFRLKNEEQMSDFGRALFRNKIPHASYYKNIFATSLEDKAFLESLGFEFEPVEVVRLSFLSLEERNAIKKRAREHLRAKRDKAIEELLRKYNPNE